MKSIVILFFVITFGIGLLYAVNGGSGALGTIIAYNNGMTSFPNDALIYSCSWELLFIIFATLGSILSVLIVHFSVWNLRFLPFFLHVLTTIIYLFSRISLVQSVVHLSTQGEIKNIGFWDFNYIFIRIFSDAKMISIVIFLLFGCFLIAKVKYFENRANKI